MSKKKLFKRRERNGVRKFWYIFIMALLAVIYLCGQQFFEWEWLTEVFATLIAIVTVVAIWLEYNENKLLNEAQFITDLNEQFIGNDKMSDGLHHS
jgi:c-di-AMP phosphodiesterase-like protein